MKINPAIFKAYDIRGIYPTDINEKNIVAIVKAIFTFFAQDLKKKKIKIILGRDMRTSSPSLFKAAKETLIEAGADILDAGLVSTPTFYFSILKYKADCGIQISASHNPKEYNGIKFAKRVGNSLIKIGAATGMDRVKELALSQKFTIRGGKGKITILKNVTAAEVKAALELLKPKHIKKFKIVADPSNAMGILYLQELFKHIPGNLIKMNFKLDGTFPSHEPDPLQAKNLLDLQKKVIKQRADLGIAPDGDGDRVIFINERGKVIQTSLIAALLAQEQLKNHPQEKVVIDIRYIKNISNAVKKAGGVPIIGKVGHALITERMHRENALFCGESSGHFFYRTTGFAESSVLTILYLLDIMSRENQPISQIVSKMQTSYESGEFNFILPPSLSGKKLMQDMASEHKKGKINWLDGIAVDYPNWRFSIRASNTEPLLRLNVEGDEEKFVKQKLHQLIERILETGAKAKE